jgi:hypothetical protein
VSSTTSAPRRAQPLGALRAVGEQVEQLVLREAVGKRTEPDLEPGVGGMPRGDLQAVRVAASDAHRGAVQVVADDAHLAPHDLRVERLAGTGPDVQEAGVVGNALGSHATCLVVVVYLRY